MPTDRWQVSYTFSVRRDVVAMVMSRNCQRNSKGGMKYPSRTHVTFLKQLLNRFRN